MSSVTTLTNARPELASGFDGEIVGRDDPGYDEARAIYNAMIDRRPGLIARPASVDDVVKTVTFARENDVVLAIRGGGHNGGGLGTVDDGLVLDLSLMKGIEIDPERRIGRFQAGLQLREVDAATHMHGLAIPAGIIGTTGVAGLTLGGGVGHLSRKYGLTIDHLLSAEIVLPDGERVTASADENPDLYWAIRGGGGNFGVVTTFEFNLNPVETVVAGPTFWPVEQSADVLKWYREFIHAAPRELNGFFAFVTVPPVPMFPEELHLQKMAAVVWCFVGSEEDAGQLLAAVEEPARPALHGPAAMPFPGIQNAFDDLYPPGHQWYWRADFVDEISDEAAEVHTEWGKKLPTMHSSMHMYPIDGAVHDVAASDTAWAYRDSQWASVIVGVDPDPTNADLIKQWTIDYFEAVHPYSAGGAYVNFMMDEGQERIQATYRDNYERLTKVKAQYDPDNFFRINQNIKPAT